MNRLPLRIGKMTYGYYYPDSESFECTHGAWSSKIDFISDTECKLAEVSEIQSYQWIDKIPLDFGGEE